MNTGSITPIRPSNVIRRHPPRVESRKNVSQWFLNETIELDFGESVGRPSENVLLQKEYITRFLENGWTIDAVLSTAEEGTWQSTSSSSGTADQSTRSSRYSGNSSSSGYYSESSESSSDTSETRAESGAAFWSARQRVRLKRRRMQPEKVMQSMTDSFTDEYNSGRSIDEQRLNEIVSLYSIVLDRNEKEANALLQQTINRTNPTAFLDKLYNSTWKDFVYAHNRAVEIAWKSEEDATADVNRQFDALLAQQKAQMITNGTYNSTVWPSVAAGIERQRSAALVKAKSESGQIGVSALTSVGSAKASAASAFIGAQEAIQKAIDNRRITASETRNTVVKWMIDYIGSREEVYPELQEISSVAERLGFSVGSAGNVL